MHECIPRRGFVIDDTRAYPEQTVLGPLTSEKVRPPSAYLVCNQMPPTPARKGGAKKRPSLMTFDDVTTLFHEFGHALQHVLTEVSQPMVSGE